MSSIRENRLFTLTIVPDSGYDMKTGNINLRLITGLLSFLIITFFVTLFFIIGYHVKLSQENEYADAVTDMRNYLDTIDKNEITVGILSNKMSNIRRIDKSFRQFAYMPVPDDNMYMAGIGGHVIVDESRFETLGGDMNKMLTDMYLKIRTIDRQLYVEDISFNEIENSLRESRDEINNTPTILPILSLNVTSKFGMRTNPVTGRKQFHDAVDFTGNRGDKIFATADGTVIKSDYHSVRGHYVIIKHKYGYLTLYAHLDKKLVKVGDRVRKEDIIGTMGSSGRTTGTNLHYSITHNNRKVNPLDYF
jgi:murein DD-endopeptidase MepM/ murein hydrolase activator NlpD